MESSTDTPVADIKTEAQTTPETEGTPVESEAPVTPGSTKRSAVDDADGESPVKKTKGKASPKGPVTPGRQRKAPVKAPVSFALTSTMTTPVLTSTPRPPVAPSPPAWMSSPPRTASSST